MHLQIPLAQSVMYEGCPLQMILEAYIIIDMMLFSALFSIWFFFCCFIFKPREVVNNAFDFDLLCLKACLFLEILLFFLL